MDIKFETDVYDLLENHVSWFNDKTFEHVVNSAKNIVDRTKLEAPWKDNTGDARRSINAKCVLAKGKFSIVLNNTVSYAPLLELGNSGRFKVLFPAVLGLGGETVTDILKKVFNGNA